MSVFDNKDDNGNFSTTFAATMDLKGVKCGEILKVTQDDAEARLVIQPLLADSSFFIAYANILRWNIKTAREIYQDNLRCGIDYRPAHLKKRHLRKRYLVICYYPVAGPQTTANLCLGIIGGTLGLAQYLAALKEKCSIIDTPPEGIYL